MSRVAARADVIDVTPGKEHSSIIVTTSCESFANPEHSRRMPLASGWSRVRVSTQKQGTSGLGLEAQRDAIARFAEAERCDIVDTFTEVETGKGADALERRPQLTSQRTCGRKAGRPNFSDLAGGRPWSSGKKRSATLRRAPRGRDHRRRGTCARARPTRARHPHTGCPPSSR
jgi:hypothetical protein